MSSEKDDIDPAGLSKTNTMSSEKKVGVAWDKCAEDVLMKFGIGVMGAGLAGAVLFRGSSMKIASAAFGAGTGSGWGLSNCENLLQRAKAENRSKLAQSLTQSR